MSQTPARSNRRLERCVRRRLKRRFFRAVVRRGGRGEAALACLISLRGLGASIQAEQAMAAQEAQS